MKGSNLSKGFFRKWKRNTLKLMLIICGTMMVTGTTVGVNKVDSLLNIANSINELNYTIPSWTLLKRAVKRATTLPDSASTAALQNSINSLQSKSSLL